MNNTNGFVKLRRSPESEQLLRDPLAFGLLAAIALRARWRRSRFSIDELAPGEAFVGDHKNHGMTRQQYRTRILRLKSWGLITVRTTNRGTITRLESDLVFDINIESNERLTNQKPTKNQPSAQPPDFRVKNGSEQPTGQPSNNQQTTSEEPLTKNERNKERVNDRRAPETLSAQPLASSSVLSFASIIDAEKHPLWKNFTAFCKSRDGSPTLKGFNTWLKSQPPPRSPHLHPMHPPMKPTERPVRQLTHEERAAGFQKFKADNRAAGLVRF